MTEEAGNYVASSLLYDEVGLVMKLVIATINILIVIVITSNSNLQPSSYNYFN